MLQSLQIKQDCFGSGLSIDPCCKKCGNGKIESYSICTEYDSAKRTLRDSSQRGYANESIVMELEKITLANVDSAFDRYEIDPI
jgi:hypothetical protein